METFSSTFLKEAVQIINLIPSEKIELIVDELLKIRESNGRLFFLGVGGSAANCSHAVNDFRKICTFEAYAPTDNVSELTARTNDEGWPTIFSEWLKVSKLNSNDGIFIFSVGGGNMSLNISPNLVSAIELAKERGSKILGLVGKDGGHTAKSSDSVLVIPTINNDHITPHSEAFQAVIWHLIVSHPKLKAVKTKWESIESEE